MLLENLAVWFLYLFFVCLCLFYLSIILTCVNDVQLHKMAVSSENGWISVAVAEKFLTDQTTKGQKKKTLYTATRYREEKL